MNTESKGPGGEDIESRESLQVALVSPIDAEAQKQLETAHHLVRAFEGFGAHRTDLLANMQVLVFRSGVEITSELMERAPNLALIVRAGSGFDNVDLGYARRRGIRVVRIPGPSADAVAEFTMGLMLSLSRHIVRADALVRDGLWPKTELGGHLLRDQVLGIIGAGNIGSRVGQLGAAWGMQVLGCVAEHDQPWEAPPEIAERDFETVLTQADFLTVHTPLMVTTRHLISSAELAAMKDGAYLINTARGGVVDEAALYEALTAGHLAGAALDVHEHEGDGAIPKLADLPNVILTPHIAGMALESQRGIGRRVIELLTAYMNDELDNEANTAELLV